MKTTLALTLTKDGGLYLNGEQERRGGGPRYIAASCPRTPTCRR